MSLVKTILEGNKIEYDDNKFKVRHSINNDYLHYVGNGINVTNPKGNVSCYRMFQDYKGTSLDLSKFDTHNITNMSCMFDNCSNLSYLNLSNFDTSNVTNMKAMFWNCENLKELDISSFYIDNTKILDNMFWNCRSLKTLKVSSDCLQFFSMNRGLLEVKNNVNIIPVSKLDKAVNDLFY